MTAVDLKQRRAALHLTQVQLAAKLGVGYSTVQAWEGGRNAIPPYLDLALREIERQEQAV